MSDDIGPRESGFPPPTTSNRVSASPVQAGVSSPTLSDLFSIALEHAVAELGRFARSDSPEIRAQLDRLVRLSLRAVSRRASGMVGAKRNRESLELELNTIVPTHYIAVLRASLLIEIEHTRTAIDAGELACALAAMERVNHEHSVGSHHDFERHLASADAVNAVVEIAHDMRSPLTSILFLVDTLQRGQSGQVTPVQTRQLGLIYAAALGLNTLTCDVIDAVRGGQRLVDGQPTPFSISEVILSVCDTVRPIAEEKMIPITEVLPANDGRIGYPTALSRVLLNLTTNALKYTAEGSVVIGSREITDERVLFWVQDTGQGIPPHVMAMLFDGFRPSTSGIRFSNAGLGLAICQKFLAALGATLEVESSPAGTLFSFELDLPRA
jgi:signal transduction histidine kinase